MAERLWKQWLHGALRCKLEPIRRVARMIREYWYGVINAATSDITNAMSESINSRIQRIKKRACGFRSRQRFREAILFISVAFSSIRTQCKSPTRNPEAAYWFRRAPRPFPKDQ